MLSDPTLAAGLRMAVADPAWMLSRQRLFGELAAEDAGSPASAELSMKTSRLTRLATGVMAGAGTPFGADGAPLEARIENEWQPTTNESSPQFAALAGCQYIRELDAAVLQILLARRPNDKDFKDFMARVSAYQRALLEQYRLTPPPEARTAAPLVALAAGRVPDGLALLGDLHAALRTPGNPPALPPHPPVAPPDVALVTVAAKRFLAWYDAATGRGLPETGAWSPERLEYQVAIGAPTAGGGELVLSTREYDSGRLDWYAFDVAPGASLGAARDDHAAPPKPRTLLPAPVTFPGMPAARLLEFEDAAVDLGAVLAEPEDVAAMLVIEFALRHGNDFFLVPLPLPVGAVSRVGELIVTDTFGVRTRIRPAAELDDGIRLFEHDVPDGRPRETSMIVFPTAADGPESAPFEEVVLARDEGANICWAIEKTVLGKLGLPQDRAQHAAEQQPHPPAPPTPDTLRYHLRTPHADHWYPLLPVPGRPTTLRLRTGGSAEEAAPVERGADGVVGRRGVGSPWGRILREVERVDLPVEEVTRDGHRITCVWRYARGTDGVPYVWAGRRSSPVAETGASGLRFDIAE